MKIRHIDLIDFVPIINNPGPKTLLHIGCGTASASRLPECFKTNSWKEIRLDIDPIAKPDIVSDITDMFAVGTNSMDAVWSSHNLEHLDRHQIPIALKEIYRVLKPGGFVLITLPDLAKIAALIVEGNVDKVLYLSPAGPITPMDMLYGHQKSIERGKTYMAHRTGFTSKQLSNALLEAGFDEVRVMHGYSYDLWSVAVRNTVDINK